MRSIKLMIIVKRQMKNLVTLYLLIRIDLFGDLNMNKNSKTTIKMDNVLGIIVMPT